MFEYLKLLFTHWLSILFRSAIILGPMVLIFWIIQPRWIQGFRINQPKVVPTITKQELPRALLGLSVYLIATVCLILSDKVFQHSVMYLKIEDKGWPYFFLSILIFAVVVDSWFYWAHRLMHSNRFLKAAHLVHHRSYNVTPISAYSFSFIESLINMFPFLLLVLLVPWHPLALFSFSVFGLFYNGYVHLGYDFGNSFRKRNPLLKWFYSSTHHSIHHQMYDKNFAVYFTFWDKLMGTEFEDTSKTNNKGTKL